MRPQPQELRIQGSALKLAARRWTMGDIPVLALHGWLDNAGTFDRLAPYMEGMDLVALDFPGHGFSEHRPPGMAYYFVDAVAEVFTVAQELGWERFALLGHSMGAGVATLAAGTFPSRVASLVLVEGLGPFTNPDHEAPGQLAKALLHRASSGQRVYPTRDEAIQRLASRGLLQDSAECLALRSLQEVDGGWAFCYDPKVRAPSRARLSESQVRAFLRQIGCPTLLVVARDGMEMPACFEGREAEVPSLTKVISEGGHHLHLDYPERISEAVLDHLRSEV
jgi:pimeloyl-ACP methyl ester carboxylesterase